MKTLSIIATSLALLSAVPAQAMDQITRYEILATAQVYTEDCRVSYDDADVQRVAHDAVNTLGGMTRENIIKVGKQVNLRAAYLRSVEDTRQGGAWCKDITRQINRN